MMIASVAPRAHAQPRHAASELGLAGGVAQFDLSGTGTTAFGALRASHELSRWFLVDAALGILRPVEQVSAPRTYLLPEAQLQMQFTDGTVRPYIGAGIGYMKAVIGTSRAFGLFSGSGGARVSVSPSTDVRAELRVTGASATLAQWTVGLARRF